MRYGFGCCSAAGREENDRYVILIDAWKLYFLISALNNELLKDQAAHSG